MMKAVDIGDGSVENMKLSEVPMPQLKAGEVLIKVHSSAINRADTLQVCHSNCISAHVSFIVTVSH